MFSGIFPGSGQTKPGAQGKKLASKAKGKCSGKSDWLMVGSVQWLKGTFQERGGRTGRQFIRLHLMRLKQGEDLPYLITVKETKRAISSPGDVLALRPELASAG
jgi:hypothetical protein